MKKLINKPNVDGVSATYPYGNMRDRGAGIQGSEMNTEFHTDYVQFFEKMFAESGLTANGLPDNFTNGFQLFEAYKKTRKPYNVYTALITQSGTSDPTVIILGQNEIGSIAWTRVAVGEYKGTLSGAFTNAKTFLNLSSLGESGHIFSRTNSNEVSLIVVSAGGSGVDGELVSSSIEIRVYY